MGSLIQPAAAVQSIPIVKCNYITKVCYLDVAIMVFCVLYDKVNLFPLFMDTLFRTQKEMGNLINGKYALAFLRPAI